MLTLFCFCADGLQQLNNNVPSEMNSVVLDQSVMVCSLREIQSITNNYSRKLGKGGFGTVYYGKLPDGMEVAVKVCDGDKHPEVSSSMWRCKTLPLQFV